MQWASRDRANHILEHGRHNKVSMKRKEKEVGKEMGRSSYIYGQIALGD